MHLEQRIGVHLAQIRNLLAFGVEVAVGARAGGQHERILLHQLGSGHRRHLRFLVVRQRVLAEMIVDIGPKLDARRGRVEARLAIRAQFAGLVLAVGKRLDLLVHDLFAKVFERTLVAQTIPRQPVVVRWELLEVARTAALANLVENLGIALALAYCDALVDCARHDRRRSVMRVNDRVMFDCRRKRQEQIADRHDGGRHEHVDAEVELRRSPSLFPTLGLRAVGAGQAVAVLEPHHANLVWLAGFQDVEHRVRMCVENERDERGIALKAQDLALQLLSQLVPTEAELEPVVDVADQLTSWDIDVSADGLEAYDGMARLDGVVLHVDGQTPRNRCGLGVRIGPRCLDDQVGVDAANLGNAFGRILSRSLGELLETPRPVFDEIMVVKIFFDDDVQHAERQRGIGARTQAQEVIGACRPPVHTRVDDHEFRTAAHHVDR